jgi:hypothetical protein
MAHLDQLPDELLVDIVERVRDTAPEALNIISLTCRKLRRISHPLQWEHVVLPWKMNINSPIARFIKAHRNNSSIKSIRLQPQRSVLNGFRVGMEHAFDHIHALCICLGSLENLKTFSLCLDDQVDLRCTMPGQVLARLIRALPPSVTHVELDTEGVDRVCEDKPVENASHHLCLAISERIAQLETLRLRLSCLCTDLFQSLSSASTPQASQLRRAYIRLDVSPNRERHISVPYHVRDCHRGFPSHVPGGARESEGPGSLSTKDFFQHLLKLQSSGAFPHLQRFMLYSWNPKPRESERYMHIRDVATRSVTQYPQISAGNSGQSRWPGNMCREDSRMIRNHQLEDFFGGRKELEKALLHEVQWMETSNGVRLPPTGKLEDVEPRMCDSGLLNWDFVAFKDQETRLTGVTTGHNPQSSMPDITGFGSHGVIVVRL